jgi:enoyl-CoA hydratase
MPHLLAARPFDADVAHSLGLVSRVLPEVDDATVDGVLDDLRRGAPAAQATIKRLAHRWGEADMDGLIEEMTAESADLFAGEEAAEGMAAFAARRDPSWVTPVAASERPAS